MRSHEISETSEQNPKKYVVVRSLVASVEKNEKRFLEFSEKMMPTHKNPRFLLCDLRL
jgi:hypothetical protein